MDERDLNVQLPAEDAPAPDLDDFQAQANPNPAPEDKEEKPPLEIKPLSNDELLKRIAQFSSMGLHDSVKKAYQKDLMENEILHLALDMIGLNEVLAKTAGAAGGMVSGVPDWVRLVGGLGVLGYFIASTRRQYATPYQKTAENPAPDGGSSNGVDLDQLALGHASNFPSR
ncbi:hypothetical protein [Deinococcus roseus]|uniref:Uncharacterized protein n=1 Tax=Deinococcus roseus TaxID=392414 RepID=A0ABQ2DGL0_9DEIO|nr:hypothetical protein [Deinococcus roseus]GGJ56541.1 hypothetical protein GCM10008938_48360 [Deinococcus roseus]